MFYFASLLCLTLEFCTEPRFIPSWPCILLADTFHKIRSTNVARTAGMWKKSTSKAAPFVSSLQIHCLQGAPVCIHTCTDDAPPDPTCELPLSYNPHTHNPSQRRLDPNLLATSFQKLSTHVEKKGICTRGQ